MTKIQFLRTELHLSQWELANASGVPRWLIQLIESGIRLPEPDQAEALAAALGSTVEQVFPALPSSPIQFSAAKED